MLHAHSPCIAFKPSRCLKLHIRELSIDGGEDITLKKNSRFHFVAFIPVRSKCQMGTALGLERERERKIRRRLFTSRIKREISHFHVYSRVVTAKKCTKKCDARVKLLFCFINLLLF